MARSGVALAQRLCFILQRRSASYLAQSRWPRTLPSAACASSSRTASRFYAQMPPRRKIDESEIEESFLKGSGPGGQKINKTNSAVQLKHLPTGIVVKVQETRSRSQNRTLARKLLGERLEVLEQGEQARVNVKAAAKSRRKASADKKKRRKYRKLDGQEQEGREGQEGQESDPADGESESAPHNSSRDDNTNL